MWLATYREWMTMLEKHLWGNKKPYVFWSRVRGVEKRTRYGAHVEMARHDVASIVLLQRN
jgi:hypothetical protein